MVSGFPKKLDPDGCYSGFKLYRDDAGKHVYEVCRRSLAKYEKFRPGAKVLIVRSEQLAQQTAK
jgi:hypothetical protein